MKNYRVMPASRPRRAGAFLVAAALLCLALPGAGRAAAPFTPHFGDLYAEMQSRVAAFVGTLTSQQKKEKSQYTSIIKKIDKKSKTLLTDLNLLVSISNTIAKSFPSDAALDTLLDALVFNFQAEVQGQANLLDITLLNTGSGKTKDQALISLLTANAFILETLSDQLQNTVRAKNLSKALGLISKSLKAALKAPKILSEGVACKRNGYDWKSTASSSFTVTPATFTLTAEQAAAPHSTIAFIYQLSGPLEAGQTYILTPGTGTYSDLDTGETFTIESGSFQILTIDEGGGTLTGRFAFFTGVSANPQSVYVNFSQGYFVTALLDVQ